MFSPADEGGINVSMAAEDGEEFIAIEYWDYGVPTESGLMVKTKNIFGNFNGPVVEFPGALTGGGIYPSIMTFPGAEHVWIAGRIDVNPASPRQHLQVYQVERVSPGDLDFDSVEPVTDVNNNFTHHVPHLVRDPVEPEQHLCWTRKLLAGGGDDVYSEAKSQPDWLSSPGRGLATTAVIEDHCMMAFNFEGYRYTVFHQANATGGDIVVRIEKHVAGVWTWVGMFPLDGSESANFPAIWIQGLNLFGTPSSSIYIAASEGGRLLYWSCSGAVGGCDSAGEFGTPTDLGPVTTGTSDADPKLVAVPAHLAGGAFSIADHDVFLFFQQVTPSPRVRVLSNCGNSGVWVDEGVLPVPSAYSVGLRAMHFGVGPAAAKNPVDTDNLDELHAAFLIEKTPGGGTFDVAHYEGLGRDFCP